MREVTAGASTFDQWYANMACSPRRDLIVRQSLGLPDDLDSSSLLPGAGLAEVTAALGLSAGQLLVDAACGRGGYGLEVARQTGARLAGVDFSPTAVACARANSRRLGLAK